jgi:hypothetical protein
LAEAANKNEKITPEKEKELEKYVVGTLIAIFLLLTYVFFFVVGFGKYT